MTEDNLRNFTYVLLGMTLGVILVALFIDIHPAVPSKKETKKEEDTSEHGKDSTRTE